jgi:hypothetical protein
VPRALGIADGLGQLNAEGHWREHEAAFPD